MTSTLLGTTSNLKAPQMMIKRNQRTKKRERITCRKVQWKEENSEGEEDGEERWGGGWGEGEMEGKEGRWKGKRKELMWIQRVNWQHKKEA